MDRRNLAGGLACLAVFAGTFFLTGNAAVYMNIAAMAIVVSGVLTAMFLSYPAGTIKNAFKVAKNAYSTKPPTPEEIVETMLDMAVKSKIDGVMSLEEDEEQTSQSFLRNGLQMLVDNYKKSEIRDCLNAEMSFFSMRRSQNERIFQTMAKLAPAFGVAGSVIGLIGLMAGIGDTGAIVKHIPIAFISTLYGIILSNMIFMPMAEAINAKTKAELLNQKLIMEGVIAILNEQNPYKLERKLTSFLTPSMREGKASQVRAITKKYIGSKKNSEARPAEPVLKEVKLSRAS